MSEENFPQTRFIIFLKNEEDIQNRQIFRLEIKITEITLASCFLGLVSQRLTDCLEGGDKEPKGLSLT